MKFVIAFPFLIGRIRTQMRRKNIFENIKMFPFLIGRIRTEF